MSTAVSGRELFICLEGGKDDQVENFLFLKSGILITVTAIKVHADVVVDV